MYAFEVSKTDLNLQDLAINLDEITELQNSSVFQLNRVENRPYEYDGAPFIAGIDIQNNLALT